MAWPFSKHKLKAPQPQAPAHRKTHPVHTASTPADVKDIAKKLEGFSKSGKTLEKEFDEHRVEMMDELKSINKNLGPLYDKDTELGKNIKELGIMDKKILSEVSKVERKVKDAKDIVQAVESVFNADSIRKLKAQLIEANNSIKLIENDDTGMLKKMQNVDRRIGIIEKHSSEISDERNAVRESAEALAQHAAELKETIGGYSDQLVELSGKVSANIAKTADIDAEVHAILGRLQSVEAQIASVTEISRYMQEHSQILAQIARRLEYLEKTTVKTVVLD